MSEENELIAQLDSDKRSVKIQAIVKLTRAGKGEQAIKALLPYLASTDRELSFFANQATGKIAERARIDLNQLSGNKPVAAVTPDQSTEPPLSRETFLSASKEQINTLLDTIRNAPEKIPDEVLPAVGVFLSRHGGISDAGFLERSLLKDNSNLALPFINAAESIAPSILPRVLPHLLASNEPLVRSRSVSALRKIDPEEAERHFSDLLTSRNPENRLAAIGIGFLFPFERVKGYILSMLPDERDQEVLIACQTVLASNPEVDTALSILDCIDAVAAEQKPMLTLIFRTACQALAATGLLPIDQASPEAMIKLWKQQRLESFLFDLEIQLSFADAQKKASIIGWIEKNRQHPKVQELIERLGKNPQTEDVFRQLTRRQSSSVPAPQTTTTGDKSAQTISDKTSTTVQVNPVAAQEPKPTNAGEALPQPPSAQTKDAEKLQKLRSMEIDEFAPNKSWIMKDARTGEPGLRAEALSTLLRVHPDGKLIDIGKEAIVCEAVEVRTAAFKILERLDPDFLKDKILALLQETDPNMRIRAVRFGLKYKQAESIEALKRLLKSDEQAVRSNAVSCLAICPFNATFGLLMDQLDCEDHPVIAKQIASILLNNPSKSLLKALDNITKTSNPAVSMVISQTRNDLFDIISQMPEISELEPAPTAEAAEKPYSVSKVREIARRSKDWKPGYKPEAGGKNQSKESSVNWQMIISGSVLLVFLALLPIMLLSDRGQSEEPAEKNQQEWRNGERGTPNKVAIPEKFRMNRPCSLSGTIEKIVSDESMVIVHDNQQIMIKFEFAASKEHSVGEKISVTIIPYRVNPHGIILSRGQEIAAAKTENTEQGDKQ
ncbi:MAG: HEAT repeat domain-containing protein [Candidatus Riflebacteria bacterium]|nr:HEAT repeat domain-containing protein [Candidatus Riflebacteria bacterium]